MKVQVSVTYDEIRTFIYKLAAEHLSDSMYIELDAKMGPDPGDEVIDAHVDEMKEEAEASLVGMLNRLLCGERRSLQVEIDTDTGNVTFLPKELNDQR